MSTVFETPPPNFSQHDIIQILLSHYSINAEANPLVSDRDQNFLIKTDKGQKYILKISNPSEQLQILDMQNEATLFIRSNDPDLGVPLQIGEIQEIEKNGLTYFVRLFKYLEGQLLKDKSIVDSSYEKLGKFLGRLNRSLDSFNHPAADREFHWDLQNIELIRSRFSYLEFESEKNIVSYFLDQYESHVSINKSHLRKMIIHNDGNDDNVLVNHNGQTTGIIDFGDMVYSYQVAEPAICMAYVGLGKKDPYRSMSLVLKGYHSRFPLNDVELSSALYLTCIRLCISVTMAAWRMKLFPDNTYLYTSQNQAWKLLKLMKNEDLIKRSVQLLTYAKS